MGRFRIPVVMIIVAVSLAVSGLPGLAGSVSGASMRSGDALLRQYAARTWASFVAMTDSRSGLPADSIGRNGARSVQTSTTNIGAYMWSTVVARRLGIISERELVSRLTTTLTTLEHMERHAPSGQFYNWYDHRTGAKLTVWPPTGATITPILSSVDNGWLAAGLRVVRGYVRELAPRAGALYDSMDFGFYYRADVNRILFHYAPSTGEAPCCYDTIVSESRIASYIGIANGQLPQREYFGAWRTFPATCDFSFQETRPAGFNRTYFGQTVFEGSYAYAGLRLVPGWGGSAFEALMPALFVPEERWGRRSWGRNHPNTVQAQIHHGMVEAGYGYWGFSPASNPLGGYREYGVDLLGMNPDGYFSDVERTNPDVGFGTCRPATNPSPTFGDGVVTPHAAFLAMMYEPAQAYENLARMEDDLGAYGPGGFYDAVAVVSGKVAERYLSLDQAMVMGALGNVLSDDVLQRAFSTPEVESVLRPIVAVEEFGAGTA